jgi:hypothetical protein
MTRTNLTESRIRRILELQPELMRRTKKDAKRFLDVPRLPDTDRDETLIDVVGPQNQPIFANTANPGRSFCNSSHTTIEGMLAGNPVGSTIISPAVLRYWTTHTPRLQSINAKILSFIAHQSLD